MQIGLDNLRAMPRWRLEPGWFADSGGHSGHVERTYGFNVRTKLRRVWTMQTLLVVGDLNSDGKITNADIQPMLDLAVSAGLGSISAVPEPAAVVPAVWALAFFGLAVLDWKVRGRQATRAA